MLNLVLFGPPGCGKGTQAARLKEKYQLEHISTGDLLRGELAAETKLGKEARKYMDKGELVPDAVIIGMVENKLDERVPHVNGFIFDGFPRTVPQAEALDDLLNSKKLSITKVLSLQVGEEELVARILNRGKTSGRSDDLDEATIRNRITVYEAQTAIVGSYYDAQSKLVNVNGVGSIDEITDALSAEIDTVVAG